MRFLAATPLVVIFGSAGCATPADVAPGMGLPAAGESAGGASGGTGSAGAGGDTGGTGGDDATAGTGGDDATAGTGGNGAAGSDGGTAGIGGEGGTAGDGGTAGTTGGGSGGSGGSGNAGAGGTFPTGGRGGSGGTGGTSGGGTGGSGTGGSGGSAGGCTEITASGSSDTCPGQTLPSDECIRIDVNTGPAGENHSPALCNYPEGPESVFKYVAPRSGTLHVTTGDTTFEKVLYYGHGTCDMPVACAFSLNYGAAQIDIATVADETYWIIIDGTTGGFNGEWGSTTLTLKY